MRASAEFCTSDLVEPRQGEISRVVWLWLCRLQVVLGQQQRHSLRRALDAAGINSLESTDDEPLQFSQLYTVLDALRDRMPDITLRLLSALEITDLGLLGHAILSSDSIHDAIRLELKYNELTTARTRVEFCVEDQLASYQVTPLRGFDQSLVDIGEDALGGYWRFLQLLLGPESKGEMSRAQVSFPYARPGHVAAYRRIFGDSVRFETESLLLQFPVEWLQRPIAVSSPDAAAIGKAIQQMLSGLDHQIMGAVPAVRALLIGAPGRRMPRLEEAAVALNMSATRLRKLLYRHGTSYKKIVLDTRMTLARYYLISTSLPVQDIAHLLDYAQPAPFSRAFRRYYGKTPLQCRPPGS